MHFVSKILLPWKLFLQMTETYFRRIFLVKRSKTWRMSHIFYGKVHLIYFCGGNDATALPRMWKRIITFTIHFWSNFMFPNPFKNFCFKVLPNIILKEFTRIYNIKTCICQRVTASLYYLYHYIIYFCTKILFIFLEYSVKN